MVSKIQLMPDELDIERRRRSHRCCAKSPLARVIAASLLVIAALMMSLIYYSIVLDRMDKLKEYMVFNMNQAEHSTIQQASNGLEIRVRSSQESTAADMDTFITTATATDHESFHIKRLQMKFFRRRLPRELLDPLQSAQQTFDIQGLYARVRNKRQRAALSKLEREYVRCKKEFKEGNDCMVAFVKMYNIAKDISARMEQMKEIFKDSEAVLLNASNSRSQELKETEKVAAKNNEELQEIVTEEETTIVTSSTSTPAGTKAPKQMKTRPSKISWILDGHDDYSEDEEASVVENETTSTTESVTVSISTEHFSDPNVEIERTTFPADATALDNLPEIFHQSGLNQSDQKSTAEFHSNDQTLHTKSIEKTTEKSIKEAAEDTAEQTVTEQSAKTTGENIHPAHHESYQKATDKTVEKSSEEIDEEMAKEAGKKATKQTTVKTNYGIIDRTADISTDPTADDLQQTSNLESFRESEFQPIDPEPSGLHVLPLNRTLEAMPLANPFNRTTPSTLSAFADTPKELLDSTFDSSEEYSARVQYDWILDGGEEETSNLDNQTTTNMMTPNPPTYPTKPQPIKISWIIDGDESSSELATTAAQTTAVTATIDSLDAQLPESGLGNLKVKHIKQTTEPAVTFGGDCAKMSHKCNLNPHKKPNAAAPTASTLPSTTSTTTMAHPLDDPCSLENMLDSFEQHEYQKPLKKSQVETDSQAKIKEGAAKQVNDDVDITTKSYAQQFQNVEQHEELIDTFSGMNVTSETLLGAKINPVNSKGFEKDPQFLTLCERLAQKMRNQAQENSGQQTFAHRGPMRGSGFPVTGETIKASAQFMYNPSFGMPTIPVCFYVTPASFRMYNQPPMWTPSYYGPPGFYGSSNGAFMGGGSPHVPMSAMHPMAGGNNGFMPGVSGGPGGVFFVPQNFAGSPHNVFGQSSGSATAFHHNNNNQSPNIFSKHSTAAQKQTQSQFQSPQQSQSQGQQFYCTYLQQQQQQQESNQHASSGDGNNDGAGTNNGNMASGMGFTNANFKMRTSNHSTAVDIIYASFAGVPTQMGHVEESKCAMPNEKACIGGNECIAEESWCDNHVDCSDGSDEAACTCRSRLAESRICDGYADCPLGEDEIGCFGCGDFMYSCFERIEDYERQNRSQVSMCYSALEKCDGIENCLNGKDERECSIIVEDVGSVMSHTVSAAEGYLFHNHRGEWFPVCNNADKWAREACDSEGGLAGAMPSVAFHEIKLPGPFIEPTVLGTVHFPQTCQKRDSKDVLIDHVAHVKCAPTKCGLTKTTTTVRHSKSKTRRSSRMQSEPAQYVSEASAENLRIVGGSWSRPLQWPFVAALYRNGNFHCGCTVYSEMWIISAAHCVINFQKYYYEVRAGLHRRSSYAAGTQIRAVSSIIVHQEYERLSMRNDLSLLGLAEPLHFNRWVKPICLPGPGRTTLNDEWLLGPKENTLCTVVGWGAVREKGPGSDQIREVILPIRKDCVEKADRDADNICAGDSTGGRDACQGDSGGPLFCRSVANSDEWYLAGVVSHGNGCARPGEFGVYTRVALYLDWIKSSIENSNTELKPLQLCPGYICIWGGKRCMPQRKRCDRSVDCLGGEDEVGCVYNFIPDVGSIQNSTSTTESDYFPENNTSKPEELIEVRRVTLAQIESEASQDTHVETKKKIRTLPPTMTTLAYVDELQTTIQEQNDDERAELEADDMALNLENTTTVVRIIELSTESTMFTNATLPVNATTTTELLTTVGKISTSTEKSATTTIDFTMTASTRSTKADPVVTSTKTHFTAPSSTLSSTSSLDREKTRATKNLTTSKFGEFRPTIDAPNSPSIHVDVHKRENATVPAGIAKLKFICQSIPQIIEQSQRCDRIVDCEDGTDEEKCSCREYLKGPLKTLICDGKPDCEDLTDEDDCDHCNGEEFYCPISKTCIAFTKRCDNISDCKFQEDEKECVALTNGKEILLDTQKHPILQTSGIFSRNMHGVWRVVCSHEIGFHQHGIETASEACSLLGFKGVKFYNTTEYLTSQDIVPIDPVIRTEARIASDLAMELEDNLNFSRSGAKLPLRSRGNKSRIEHIAKMHTECLGLYVECHAKSNKSEPLKTISAGFKPLTTSDTPKLDVQLQPNLRPNVLVKPLVAPVVLEKKEEIMQKLDKMIESERNSTVVVNNKLHKAIEELHWPWVVDVYKNGKLWCLGILVEQHWVVVHETCFFSVRLQTDYIAVLLGGGKTKGLLHKSTQEQIRRVDCLVNVPHSDVILYHLQEPVRFTHHVLPIFLPDLATYNESADHECIAVLHDSHTGRIKSVAVIEHKEDELCKNAQTACYTLLGSKLPAELMHRTDISSEELANLSEEVQLRSDELNSTKVQVLSKFTFCKQFGHGNRTGSFDAIDQGILVCHEQHNGWYPTALFAYNNTDCSSFRSPFGVRTLDKSIEKLQKIIEHSSCEHPYSMPICMTHRCPLGDCLEVEKICNGRNDCHDGSDETEELCAKQKRECKPSEMKCRSSQKCIPKTRFCDHVPDCEDFTDEPTVCSCYTYLQATDPSKICDGVRNCWDKSDESPVFCNCTADRFPCGASAKECIPRDFVCDKEVDCPNGEDEAFCYGIEQPLQQIPFSGNKYERPTLYGQVIEQSYGIWHTKCFPRDTPPDLSEVRQICKKLGYRPYGTPTYRLIDDVQQEVVESNEPFRQMQRNTNEESLVGKYRDATKAVVVSRFSPLQLNDELTLFLKPSRPIAELMRWNATDSSNCYRMEIKCA